MLISLTGVLMALFSKIEDGCRIPPSQFWLDFMLNISKFRFSLKMGPNMIFSQFSLNLVEE